MKILIKLSGKEVALNLQKVTQVLGQNFNIKNSVLKSIKKHFSKTKYFDYEDAYINNVRVNGEEVGREYFQVIAITNKDAIIDQLQVAKSTLMMQYITKMVDEVNVDKQLFNVEKELVEIYDKINNKFCEDIDRIKLDYSPEGLLSIVSKSDVLTDEDMDLYYLDSYTLLLNLIKIVNKLFATTSKKILLIVEDIDHILKKAEYKSVIDYIMGNVSDNIYFIFTASVSNFAYVNRNIFAGINVINSTVFNVGSYDRMIRFIENTYPCEYKNELELTDEMLESVITEVGIREKSYGIRAKIFKNLINRALMINDERLESLNSAENAFIFH